MKLPDEFTQSLERILKGEPPYWVFLFISTFFVIFSLLAQYQFKEIWAFFLYSAIGTLWRHMNKDLFEGGPINVGEKWRRIIYHVVNVVILATLFIYFWVS